MFNLAITLPSTDWVRLSALYLHLLCCAFALVFVLSADWGIATGRFTTNGLRRTAHRTTFMLAMLWITGFSLVYIDTGWELAVLLTMPKLLLKLVTVLILTANGIVLHSLAFALMTRAGRLNPIQSLLLSITGALSTSHWLLAAFIGVARPLGQWPVHTLMTGYAIYCLATLCAAVLAAPVIRRRLAQRAPSFPCFPDRVQVPLRPGSNAE